MAIKRLNIEIPWEQYQLLRREATLRKTTISGIIRHLIDELKRPRRRRTMKPLRDDPFFKMGGSFDGPPDLSEKHDEYLYGGRR